MMMQTMEANDRFLVICGVRPNQEQGKREKSELGFRIVIVFVFVLFTAMRGRGVFGLGNVAKLEITSSSPSPQVQLS